MSMGNPKYFGYPQKSKLSLIYFSLVTRQKQPKTKTTKQRQKTQHEHNNPTCSVPSYWSTDPEEVSTGYCYFEAVCGRTSLGPPRLYVVFSGITWGRHNSRCQAIINRSISFGVSCCYEHMPMRLIW